MYEENKQFLYQAALTDFQKARRRAAMEQLLARFSGRSTELLSFDEVRQQLGAGNPTPRGLQDIPLDKIVGSVGRYQDFTRSFLPKQDSDEERWAKVKTAVEDLSGVPPIEVYQVGEAYFVRDGNHRVSIARQLDVPSISAYVTEVKTRVPLAADDDPEEIICKARYAEFLEATDLDTVRPQADLLMTFCGHYRLLGQHIEVHRHYLGNEEQRFIPYEEAVASWYDHVYLPVIRLVREQGVLRYFPGRTEADMYVLLAEYRAELTDALGWEVAPETAVAELARQKKTPLQALAEAGSKLLEAVLPEEVEPMPPPGSWRLDRVNWRQNGRLFDDILVAMGPDPADWRALDLAIGIAQQGGSRLLGLHVIDGAEGVEPAQAEPAADEIRADEIRAAFENRCREAGVRGEFAVERGPVAQRLVRRAVYADGVVIPLNHAPETITERYLSGLQTILRKTPRPILTAPPGAGRPLRHALLAYGGTRTVSDEALYVAAYLSARHNVRLSVVSVGEPIQTHKALARVREYLQNVGAAADFFAEEGGVEETLLQTAEAIRADFLIVGGFGYSPLRSLLWGSTANRLLQEYDQPILICR